MTRPTPHATKHRFLRTTVAPAVLALALTACGSPGRGGDEPVPEPTVVTGSSAWQGLVSADEYRNRLSTLTSRVTELRTTTRSGWTGVQDDATGNLAVLGGGTWKPDGSVDRSEMITGFVEQYGEDLFGVSGDEIRPERTSTALGALEVVRAQQVHQGIPVVDGRLIFSVAREQGTLRDVRGRSFGGIDVGTTPRLSAAAAIRAASTGIRAGRTMDRPVLRIVPEGSGVLAWRVTVQQSSGTMAGQGAAHVYVDATTGAEVRRDPLSAAVGSAAAASLAPAAKVPDGESVQVTGTDPFGQPVRAQGLRTARGVELIDTTMPWFNRATGAGAITTHSMDGSDDDNKLPGNVVVNSGTVVADNEAIYAHALARQVLDAFQSVFGWTSWDGKGAALTTVVNLGGDDLCNAFFGTWGGGTMSHGNPCVGPNGAAILVAPDVTAHEITHGVTAASAGLVYAGQSGALSEAFSDYFGNVIGNMFKGTDDSTIGEDSCVNVSKPQRLCDNVGADGKLSLREMLNGTTYPDLLKILGTNIRVERFGGRYGDDGGVHLNSSIWNNAMWTIRTKLAQIDGKPGNDSDRAKALDKLVFAALTTQLTPTSGMVDASQALLSVINQAGTDPVIARVARETLAGMKFCDDCGPTPQIAGNRLTRTTGGESSPVVAGDRVAWIDNERAGRLWVTNVDGGTPRRVADGYVVSTAAAGDSFVFVEELNGKVSVVRLEPNGRRTVLHTYRELESASIGVGGSGTDAAWVDLKAGGMFHVDAAGKVTSAPIPNLGGDRFQAVAAGGGSVGFGGKNGGLYLWQPGTGPTGFSRIGQVPGSVFTVAAYGDRVFGVDRTGNGALFQAGQRSALKTMRGADGFHGATMTSKYLIWSRFTDQLASKVADVNSVRISDVDLALHSFGTGKDYSLVRNDGQQAYPSASETRLAWVDASHGNPEILADTLPGDL